MFRAVSAVRAAAFKGWSQLGLNVATARGPPGKTSALQTARDYAKAVRKKKQDIPSHLDDLPPTMLMKDYAKVPVIEKVDDVVRRLLSLEMACQKEKVKIKREQLADKVRKDPSDKRSLEVRVAYLTATIRTMKEHLQLHPKDKNNRRCMLMAIDHRNMFLKYLRNTHYDVFENTCKQLGIEYVFPPLYCRRATKRWVVKKAFCIKVFQEVKKQKALGILKPRRGRSRAARVRTPPNEGTPI